MTIRTRLLPLILLSLALLVSGAPGVAAQAETTPPWRIPVAEPHDRIVVTVGDHDLDTMLAVTPGQQTLGMGYRNTLGADEAMLFVNESAEPRTFWMKGMRYCLDIIWIEQGIIVGAAENTCPDPEGTSDADRLRVSSPQPVTYVLETRAGWLADHGYGTGTRVTIPALPAS